MENELNKKIVQANSIGRNNIFFVTTILLTISGLAYQIIVQLARVPIQVFALICFALFMLEYVYVKSKELNTETTALFRKRIIYFVIWAGLYIISIQFFNDSPVVNMFGFQLSKTAMFVLTVLLITCASNIYLQYSNSKSFEKLAGILFVSLVFNAILSIRALIINPSIMRILAGRMGNTIELNFNILGLSGYAEVYTTAIIFPLLIGSIKLLKGNYKILAILLSILLFIYVFMSALATAMLIMVLGILLIIYLNFSKVKKVLLLPLILIILVTLFSTDISSQLITNIAELIEIPQYKQKLLDISSSIYEDEVTGTVEDRTFRYEQSIKSFLKNPLVGVSMNRNGIYDIGGHATIIDIFGFLGIFGGIPFLLFTIYSYKICIVRWSNTPYITMIRVCFINFFIIASLKSIMSSYPIFLTIILFIPITPYYIEKIKLLSEKPRRIYE